MAHWMARPLSRTSPPQSPPPPPVSRARSPRKWGVAGPRRVARARGVYWPTRAPRCGVCVHFAERVSRARALSGSYLGTCPLWGGTTNRHNPLASSSRAPHANGTCTRQALQKPLVMPAILAPIGVYLLSLVGFTSGGVAAGSFAAMIQAAIGNVGAGGLFAAFQSAGATGGGALASGIGGTAAAGGGGIFTWFRARAARAAAAAAAKKAAEEQQEMVFVALVVVLLSIIVLKPILKPAIRERVRLIDAYFRGDI